MWRHRYWHWESDRTGIGEVAALAQLITALANEEIQDEAGTFTQHTTLSPTVAA